MNRFISIILFVCTAAAVSADPYGELQFKEYTLDRTIGPDGSTVRENLPENGAYISLYLQYMEPDENIPGIQQVRDFIRREYFGSPLPDAPDAGLENIAEEEAENWRENGLSILEDFPEAVHTASWDYSKGMTVEFNNGAVISFGIHWYQYAGGAHGMYGSDFFVYDLHRQKPIELSDLFRGDWAEPLAEIITQKAREMYELADEQFLYEAGFFIDILYPTENFYMTAEGITFFYDVYEVAPYVMGSSEIFVPFETLDPLLKR